MRRISLTYLFLISHALNSVQMIRSQNSILLRQYPLIVAHDSATTYLNRSNLVHKIVANFTQTQPSGTFKTLLDCGARSLDLRLGLNTNKQLYFHHGSVKIKQNVKSALQDVIDWTNLYEGELILLLIDDCSNDDTKASESECYDVANKMFDDLNINQMNTDECASQLKSLSYSEAVEKGIVKNQKGSILALFGCVDSNYDPSIKCENIGYESSIFKTLQKEKIFSETNSSATNTTIISTTRNIESEIINNQELYGITLEFIDRHQRSNNSLNNDLDFQSYLTYCCYENCKEKQIPMNQYQNYLKKIANEIPNVGKLTMIQSHWQYDLRSIIGGTIHKSSILLDESRSQLNQKYTRVLNSTESYPHVNLVEVDNICDGGNDLKKELYSRIALKGQFFNVSKL